ncbi:MAG: class I SAM-dependent methyltransferase [Verrucomicrobiota bacterium]
MSNRITSKTRRSINTIDIIPRVLCGVVANFLRNPKSLRNRIIPGAFTFLKLQAAKSVENIDIGRITGIERTYINCSAASYDRVVLCALAKLARPRNFFEIGTYLGETTLALAQNHPDATIYTLDLPDLDAAKSAALEMSDEYLFARWDRGLAFRNTLESARIRQLTGDSATFDFTPYTGKIDMAFIDGSHSYSYVKSDTEEILRILSPSGTIAWHDYPSYPGVYAYLNELGATLERKIYHINDTGVAFSTRMDLIH